MKKVRNILIVDDDSITCFLNQAVLDSMQVAKKVHCFTDARAALSFLEQSCSKEDSIKRAESDLVLLDFLLNGMDGLEFLEELEKNQRIDKSRLLIVVLTSHLDERKLEETQKFNVHGFFAKPLTTELVEELLATLPTPCLP